MDEINPQESRSIFEKLKDIRTAKGIKLDEITAQTKINLSYLQALEAGQPETIPAVYDTLFLKTYLTYLGIENQQEYLDEIAAIRREKGSHQTTIIRKAKIEQADRRKSGVIKLLYVGLPLLIVATIIIVLAINSTPAESDLETEIKELSVQDVVKTMQPEVKPVQEQPGDTVLVDSTKVSTRLLAIERTWLRVIKDRRDTLEYMLRAKESLKIEADSVLSFVVGKAAGVSFTINEDSVGLLGDATQVVTNLTVTANGIENKQLKQVIKRIENADTLDNN